MFQNELKEPFRYNKDLLLDKNVEPKSLHKIKLELDKKNEVCDTTVKGYPCITKRSIKRPFTMLGKYNKEDFETERSE